MKKKYNKTNTEELYEKINEAKEIKGDDVAVEIAEYLHAKNIDTNKLKASCPWHEDSTPSFIWNRKNKCWRCFGKCARNYSILDMYIDIEGTFIKAVKRLFKETGIEYNFSNEDYNNDIFKNYVYPKEETGTDLSNVINYLSKRGISEHTIRYANVKQDKYGNIAFECRDVNNKLLAVKYRKAGHVKKNEPKMWWQRDSSMCPILYNVSKIDITKPLVIVEGFIDALAVIESGYNNVVSIPGGANDTSYIEFNYDFLENFDNIILWYDNDGAGQDGLNKAVKRLGEYRCKIVKPDSDDEDSVEAMYANINPNTHIRKTDANNVLLACGKERIIQLINNAEEIPIKNISYLMDEESKSIADIEKFPTLIKGIDDIMYGNLFPCLTIYSGLAGCVDADTEFFNGLKWKKISEYNENDCVLEYDEGTDRAILSKPIEYVKLRCDKLHQVYDDKNNNIMCLSDEHNVMWFDDKYSAHKTKFSKFEKLINSKDNFNSKIKSTFRYNGSGISLNNNELELYVILKSRMLNLNEDNNTITFRVNNNNEMFYTNCILKNLYIESKINYSEKLNCHTVEIKIPKFYNNYFNLYNCSDVQSAVIKNIVFNFSEHVDNNYYFCSNNEKIIDLVQFILLEIGYMATIKSDKNNDNKILVISDKYCEENKYYNLKNPKVKEVTTKDGYKYCFTMPRGTLILRKNGNVFVTYNSGKSSLTGISTVISALEANEKIFIFSGELSAGQLADWILSPLAGYNHIMEFKNDSYDRSFYRITDQAESKIREYYRKNILLYNSEDALETSATDLLNTMEVAYKKFGCRVFLIDNLMSLSLDGDDADGIWTAQKKFTIKLANFTRKYEVNVNLVAHPRKPSSNTSSTGASIYDISGASELGNLCHRMIWVSRIKDDSLPPDIGKIKIEAVKDRPTQSGGQYCEAFYDKKTRRIYTNNEEKMRVYSWEKDFNVSYNPYVENRLICNINYNSVEEPPL